MSWVTGCSGASSSEQAPQSGDDQNVTSASGTKKLVGTWKLETSVDTDMLAEWIDKLEAKDDGTFSAGFGGNVCDDDGNCEAGTRSADGTYSVEGSTVTFKYKFQGKDGKEHSTNEKFSFTLSGSTLKMRATSDKSKQTEFTLKKG
jgi:hypothetical protein